jgi:hypothetical protein
MVFTNLFKELVSKGGSVQLMRILRVFHAESEYRLRTLSENQFVCAKLFALRIVDTLGTKESRAPTKFDYSCASTERKSLKPISLCYRTSRFKLFHLTDSIRNCMGK